MTDASKNAEKLRGKPFKAGWRGGPGRPAGSRNKATIMLDRMAEADAKTILQSQIEKAKEGDAKAAEMILSRVWPARKGRAINLNLPPLEKPADIVAALGAVADAVAVGQISPDEAQAVAAVLETKRRAIETTDLEKRIETLEAEKKGK
jgi:hypothetical protein